jgi:hypothetical protein
MALNSLLCADVPLRNHSFICWLDALKFCHLVPLDFKYYFVIVYFMLYLQCSKCDGTRRYGVPLLFPEMKKTYRHFRLLVNCQNAPKCIDSHAAFQKFSWGWGGVTPSPDHTPLGAARLDPQCFTLAPRTRGLWPLDRPPHPDYHTPTYLFPLRALVKSVLYI